MMEGEECTWISKERGVMKNKFILNQTREEWIGVHNGNVINLGKQEHTYGTTPGGILDNSAQVQFSTKGGLFSFKFLFTASILWTLFIE